jgi:hypothetical protein
MLAQIERDAAAGRRSWVGADLSPGHDGHVEIRPS